MKKAEIKRKKDSIEPTGTPLYVNEKFPMNIAQDIFDRWQPYRRKYDTQTIAEKLECSKPIIERAVNNGHTKDPHLVSKITKFFLDRAKKEAKQAGVNQ